MSSSHCELTSGCHRHRRHGDGDVLPHGQDGPDQIIRDEMRKGDRKGKSPLVYLPCNDAKTYTDESPLFVQI
ncbi:unnamed protein product [Boreogadus saida]